MSKDDKAFMDYVQGHEREWGTDMYPDRPSLVDILQAKVVVFWEIVPQEGKRRPEKDERLSITLHDNLEEIGNYLSQFILRSALHMPRKRIKLIYNKGKQVRIASVTIHFETID